MKILVIGNGFDLAHYLPTSYNHFMGVMAAIEKLPDGKDEIGFDELFVELAESEKWFFDRTKELYSTDSMKFRSETIKTIKEKLKVNTWYRYFHKHLEIDTWIDFETKIGEVLEGFSLIYEKIDGFIKKGKNLRFPIKIMIDGEANGFIRLSQKEFDLLEIFGLLIDNDDGEVSVQLAPNIITEGSLPTESWIEIKSDFLSWYERELYGLNLDKLLKKIKYQLNDFVEIFDLYLSSIISAFNPNGNLIYLNDIFDGLMHLYSFNYTSTYLKLYPKSENDGANVERVHIDYLHGKAGNISKKLVLGISELPSEILKQHKAYGFVKYHQKLFNNTDYQFLSENQKAQSVISNYAGTPNRDEVVEVLIWGHSLDESDQEYIKEIFSFNEGKASQGPVKVKIFFHNEASRFAQIANLLHILGKTLVERWMKKGWLKFEPVPDIYALNTQKPTHQIQDALYEFEPNLKIERDQPVL